MKKLFVLVFALLTITSLKSRAEEGMWLLQLVDKLNIGTMTEMGLKLTAEDIYSINKASLKDAVVIFGRGCTGEMVSPEGLILTNHHCGFSQIQNHSSVENDYIKNGFWAMTREEELPNPGLSVSFLVRIEDVTDRILGKVNSSMTEEERREAIRSESSVITIEAAGGTKLRAQVSPFYGGNQFFLVVYEVYPDVRLVGAPPEAIGNYGHDTDNWMWPRHAGDFSVFRVYMSPDGNPAEYSKENVPYKPKHYLPVSLKGLDKNDFAMVIGYPGSTTRYMTSYEVEEAVNIVNESRIKIRDIRQKIWLEDMLADPKVAIQYASKYSPGSTNGWKYSIGQNEGIQRLRTTEKKAAFEGDFMRWVNEDPARVEKYGYALPTIEKAIKGRAGKYYAQQYLNEVFRGSCEMITFAGQQISLEEALESGDKDKISEMAARAKRGIERFYKNYNYPTDIKTTKAMLKLYMSDISSEYWPGIYQVIEKKYKGDIDRYVEDMFSRSFFTTAEKFKSFLEKPDLKTLQKDPAFVAGKSVASVGETLQEDLDVFNDDLAKGRRSYIAGVMEYAPDRTKYPDANSTMRLTYGKVLDYFPYDGVHYNWITTTQGVLEKYKPGDYEFNLPERYIELVKNKKYGRYASTEGYMPVCFITTNDITGGNSGSPVMNGNGELIGLAFDGNWEAMTDKIAFEPELQRCICVDIRYVLWVIDVYAGAGHLVNEMDIR